jgi:integrase
MKKKHWPRGLRERDGYFSWVDPKDGRELGIGSVPYATAARQALEANLKRAGELAKPRLAERIDEARVRTVDAFCDIYEKKLELRVANGELKTLKMQRTFLRAVRDRWSGRMLERQGTLEVAEFLNVWKGIDQMRMAKAGRSFLGEFFRSAEAEGWIPRGSNPVTVTDKVVARVKRARLTLDAFQTIYEAAAKLDPWIRRSMELAIISAQRREDLGWAEFTQKPTSRVYVAEKWLCVIQAKAHADEQPSRLRIPLELRLNSVGWSLDEIVKRCRDDVVSRWLIHHSKPRTKSKPGDQVWIDTITKGFSRARDRTSLTWPDGQTPPTFHEIRSLAERLYAEQGVNTQELLGHKNPQTTRLYHDSRGAEWIDIKVA